ncbi:7-deoxyloganetic acid glucosyltransferase [Ranunculus cassubicifolius]
MDQKPVPHVLIFPFPAQGHINCMLKLAELLCLSNLHVTFLNTEYNHLRLHKSTDVGARFACFPRFRFQTISDGTPVDQPRSLDFFSGLLYSIKTVIQPIFKEMLFSGQLISDNMPPVTCIIADGILTFTIDVAEELGIASIAFRTPSACYYWISFCLPQLIEAEELPFQDDDLDDSIKSVPGMEGFLRCRDLPSFCRAKDLNDVGFQLILTETIKSTRASAQILNTFEDLEGPVLSKLRTCIPKLYTLGPLHALLNSRRKSSYPPSTCSSSLLAMDRSCMKWLDSQPSKSVLYVSFGSVVFVTHNQVLEFWYGLVNSGKRFLWVIRPDFVTDKENACQIPEELQVATKERGYIVEWCPQEEVLLHPALGAFFTHSGWNSTLEAIVAGLPMICWPKFADQPVNSRYVSEVWKIGFDMKDICDRSTVERMVRDLMDDKKNKELLVSVDQIAAKAKKCVSQGGSSYLNMDMLIEDIKLMRLGVSKKLVPP